MGMVSIVSIVRVRRSLFGHIGSIYGMEAFWQGRR
jgi:hypothetical protein